MMLTLKFFNCKQAHQKANHCRKKKRKGEKGKAKKNLKIKSLTWRDVGHFVFLSQNFDFFACLSQNVVKHDASGRKANIQPISSLKISKMSKKCILGKKLEDFYLSRKYPFRNYRNSFNISKQSFPKYRTKKPKNLDTDLFNCECNVSSIHRSNFKNICYRSSHFAT